MIDRNGKPHHVVLEGGSIDVNGQGLMLSTEECLLSKVQQRNPGLSQRDLEQVFADYLGVEKVIWLGCGIKGDDTHGHVDDISRFVAADTVLTVVERNRSDANYEPLQENLRRLRAATDFKDASCRSSNCLFPALLFFADSGCPPVTPIFISPTAWCWCRRSMIPTIAIALNILADLFPDREIVGIHCGDFIWGLGAIHCMTQQQPEKCSSMDRIRPRLGSNISA